jgi:maleate cis-trans isomerase
MHTLSILDDLEQAVGTPVLTANQVTDWKGLDLAGAGRQIDGLGTLLAEPVTAGGRS